MKIRIILLFALLCATLNVYSQCNCPPNGGDEKQLPIPPHPQHPADSITTSGGISADPNEIIGPAGYDSIRWVSINDVLNYTILFENDPEFASANAQKVDVRFSFDDKAWMRGFGLGSYGFANYSWNIDKSPAAYQNRLDLRDSMKIYVDLNAGIDVVKKQAFWTFSSIDPETGLHPWQVDRGMLPVNDSTHVGEGYVRFSLKPYEGLKTGDTISIAANIVFDQNDTIPTNRWKNVIDAGMPTSKVKGKVDSKNKNLYHLTLTAADDKGGSGLKKVTMYLANNFGIYEEYAVCPVDTIIDFEAEPGRQYKFYSLAEDNVGNLEPLKSEPDLFININAAPTDITLSDSIFQDDIAPEGFIGELASKDADGSTFTYALAEGKGAVHNDLFQISGSQLQAKNTFKCAVDTIYQVRISTTDEGGLSFEKPFVLHLKNVLEKPKTDTLSVKICEGDVYNFHGKEYEKAGIYYYTKSNEFMCDSVYMLQLTVLPRLEAPKVSIEGACTLVSSADKNNIWFKEDGTAVEGATDKKFTPTEDGVYYAAVSNGSCLSAPSQSYYVQVSDQYALHLNLAKGWNWVSSNLADVGYQKAKDFLKPIEAKVESLIGSEAKLTRDPQNVLAGDLVTLSPTSGYLMQTNSQIDNIWNGHACKADATAVSLKKGWNWLGYLPVYENSLEKAFENLAPVEGDIIKDYTRFATYTGGKWQGTLVSMQPGNGYMYYSGKSKTFHYPVQQVFPVITGVQEMAAPEVVSHWQFKEHTYPYNMNMIATVQADKAAAPAGLFIVGAFVGNECRGVGQYVGDRLYMTLYGDINASDKITFKAWDSSNQQEYNILETVKFANKLEGTVAAPFKLTIGEPTGINNVEINDDYNIYPNPVRSTLYVNGDISQLKSVLVIANNGAVVAKTNAYKETGLNVSHLIDGAYIVVLKTTRGTVIKRILKSN